LYLKRSGRWKAHLIVLGTPELSSPEYQFSLNGTVSPGKSVQHKINFSVTALIKFLAMHPSSYYRGYHVTAL
jgi:hypothetical protein